MKGTGFVLLLGSLALCSCQQANLKRVRVNPEPVYVKVDTLESVGSVFQRSYVGTVDVSREATLTANYGGDLVELLVRQGQKVNPGQAIAKIKSQAVKSSYDAAMATLAQAEDGYARAKKVYDKGSMTEVKMMEINTKLSQARASADAAKKALEECTVRAPFAGEIADVHVHKGEHVIIAQPIATLVKANALEVSISVPESEAYSIKAGDRAMVSVPALGIEIEAVMKNRAAIANSISHSYKCSLDMLQCPPEVLPGMVCKVSMQRDGVSGIVIPASVVKLDDGGKYVWTVDSEGVVSKRRIVNGGYSGKGIVVTEGLAEGDMLIVEGASKVSTGMKVKIKQ